MTRRSRTQDLNVCGVTAAIVVVEGKWKSALLWLLESGPQRPGELRRQLPGLSEKVLTEALREMEADGLVHRQVHDVLPLKTVYSLTDFGRDLSEALAPLSDWGHRRLERLRNLPSPAANRPSDQLPSASPGVRALPSTHK